jgi:hypothetical protein
MTTALKDMRETLPNLDSIRIERRDPTIDIKDPLQGSRDATLSIPAATDGRRQRHRLQVT